jgi:hypothetical protein
VVNPRKNKAWDSSPAAGHAGESDSRSAPWTKRFWCSAYWRPAWSIWPAFAPIYELNVALGADRRLARALVKSGLAGYHRQPPTGDQGHLHDARQHPLSRRRCVAVLGYQLYQDRKKPEGVNINLGPGGISIEKK